MIFTTHTHKRSLESGVTLTKKEFKVCSRVVGVFVWVCVRACVYMYVYPCLSVCLPLP